MRFHWTKSTQVCQCPKGESTPRKGGQYATAQTDQRRFPPFGSGQPHFELSKEEAEAYEAMLPDMFCRPGRT